MASIQYYQNDPQWQHVKIGLNDHLTIGMVGCLLTSLTMLLNHFGANETPLTLNNKLVASNGFSGAWIRAAAVPSNFSHLGMIRQKYVECKNPMAAPMADIDAGLAAGSLLLVQVDRQEDLTFGEEDGHWVVIHKKEGNDYLIWDPWYSAQAPNTLLGRYGFGYKKAEEVIQVAIWHGRGELPKSSTPLPPFPTQPTPVQPPPPTLPKVLRVVPSASLTLRRRPAVSNDNVLKVLPPKAILTVLDHPAEAIAKLSQPNQWLRVREPEGTEGFIAAWLVKETRVTPAPPPPRTPVTPPAPAPKVRVKTIHDGISLRSAPQVMQETFIIALAQGVILDVQEVGEPARKIGVQGQWLNVRTPSGREGYVAAWYVNQA